MKSYFLHLIIITIFFAVNVSSQISHRYDLLQNTDSDFRIIARDVAKERIKNSFYRDRVFFKGRLTRIEYRDTMGRLHDNPYSPAVTRLYLDRKNRIIKTEMFNSSDIKVTDFSGVWSEEYFYDRNDRIIKYVPRDTNNNLSAMADDTIPVYLEYRYVKDSVLVTQRPINGTIITRYMQKKHPRVFE